MTAPLLELRDLRKHFPIRSGLPFMASRQSVHAVDGVSLSVGRGETFGIVGESGCGKTTLSRVVLLLEGATVARFGSTAGPSRGCNPLSCWTTAAPSRPSSRIPPAPSAHA